MATPTIVSASESLPNSGAAAITLTIQQDGSAKNLSGITVTATVRRESAQDTEIHADLEDHAVTVTTAADGIVTLTLTSADMQKLDVSEDANTSYAYLIGLKCSDGYFPQPYRIFVHRVLD